LPAKLSGASWFKDSTERAYTLRILKLNSRGINYEKQFKTNSFEQLKIDLDQENWFKRQLTTLILTSHMEPSDPFKARKSVDKSLYALTNGFVPRCSQNLGPKALSLQGTKQMEIVNRAKLMMSILNCSPNGLLWFYSTKKKHVLIFWLNGLLLFQLAKKKVN
jgi:hypothetical protein